MAKAKKPIPDGYATVTPMLSLNDAKAAVDWYKQAFGAEELARNLSPDGKIAHGEIRIGNSRIMLHDAMMGGKGPKEHGGSPASLWLFVEDCDALWSRAIAAGAEVRMPLGDQFWGDRCGTLIDPEGYGWTIATRKEDLSPAELEQRAAEAFKQFPKK